MSPAIRGPADETISAPMTPMGSMTTIPYRIPQLSAIQPTRGRINNPGRTQSEPIENTIDRARGGAAIDSTASIPGPRIAPQMMIVAKATAATLRLGEKA